MPRAVVGTDSRSDGSDGIQICRDGAEVFPKYAPKAGFEFVYQGSGSLAQPDFTAECLAARNAGAQVLVPIMDANSVQRIARSCNSVGYKPVFSVWSPPSTGTAVVMKTRSSQTTGDA